MPRPVLSITQVSQRLGVSSKTIRIYEAEGFIRLERVANRCLVDPEQVAMIALIERLKADLGINLPGIGVILEMRRKMEAMQNRMDQMEQEMKQQLQQLSGLKNEYETKLTQALTMDRRFAHRAVRPGVIADKDKE